MLETFFQASKGLFTPRFSLPPPPPPAGETTTTVAPQVPGGVSDGRWHSVQVQYYNKVGRSRSP